MIKWFILGMLAQQFISLIAWLMWDSDDKTAWCSAGIWAVVWRCISFVYTKVSYWICEKYFRRYVIRKENRTIDQIIYPKHKAEKIFKVIYVSEDGTTNHFPEKSVVQVPMYYRRTLSELLKEYRYANKISLSQYGQE